MHRGERLGLESSSFPQHCASERQRSQSQRIGRPWQTKRGAASCRKLTTFHILQLLSQRDSHSASLL